VRLARARAGEWVALAGAACVIVSLFVRNYERPPATLDAWRTFGPGVVLLLLAAVAGVALFVTVVAERSTAIPVAVEVMTVPFAFAAVIAAIVRALERPDGASAVCFGAWLALAGAVLVLAGAWQAMRDEHGRLYPPATPTPRPRP
jgi:uncharacterized integral membrane protein